MKIKDLRQIIREEIRRITEDESQELEKKKQELEKQKNDINQQKVDLQKKKIDAQSDDAFQDRTSSKEEGDKQQTQQQQNQNQQKPNINFSTQGEFYLSATSQLKNFVLQDGNKLSDREIKFIALAVQKSKGRFDNGFKKYLTKGYAGNVYGKDFDSVDIDKIMDFVKKNEIVR